MGYMLPTLYCVVSQLVDITAEVHSNMASAVNRAANPDPPLLQSWVHITLFATIVEHTDWRQCLGSSMPNSAL